MRSMRAPGLVLGVGLVAGVLSSYADDAGPGFQGTWNGRPRDGTSTISRLVVRQDAEGRFELQLDLAVGGERRQANAAGRRVGDALEFAGTIPGSIVGSLSGSPGPLELRGSLELLAPDRLRGRWSLSDGTRGLALMSRAGSGWKEVPMSVDAHGLPVPGTPEDEARLFQEIAKRVTDNQAKVAAESGQPPQRGFHNKGFGLRGELRVAEDLAPDLRVDVFQPGARLPAIARFSNAPSMVTPDRPFDPRGFAFRLHTGRSEALLSGVTGDARDFLLIDSATTPPDPVRFIDIAQAADSPDPVAAFKALAPKYGAAEIQALLTGLARKKAAQAQLIAEGKKTGISFTEETWTNGAAIRWGPALAVKVALVPATTPPGPAPGADRREDMRARLGQGDVVFDLCLQRFQDEATTPIENGGVAWPTPLERVGQLVLVRQDIDSPEAKALQAEIERTALNPWNTVESFRPLGAIMRARRVVYQASAEGRGAKRCPFGFDR